MAPGKHRGSTIVKFPLVRAVPGGLVLCLWCALAPAQDTDVNVAVFYGGGPLENDLRQAGIAVRDLAKRGRWDLAGFFRRAARAVRRVRPHVIYAFLVAPNLLSLLLRPFARGAPAVWGVRASNMDLSHYDGLARVSFRTGCVLSRLANRIVVNSVAGRDYHVEQGYPPERMVVVPNGVDTDRFRPDPAAGRALRDELGLGHDRRVIGIVARFDPMKDHRTFLQAAARMAGQRADVSWLVVGGGPDDYVASMKQRASALGLDGRLVWTGPRADVEAAYNAMDVATSTSAFGEGFPNAVAEALACGRPCVVTDVGDSALVVDDPRRVVPPGDPEALADAWQRCLDAPDRKDAQTEHRRIVREFSVDALCRRTERELERTVLSLETG